MILPNKAVPYSKSILSKLPELLVYIENPIDVAMLYSKTIHLFNNVEEFIFAIDLLKILAKIEFLNGDIINVSRVDL